MACRRAREELQAGCHEDEMKHERHSRRSSTSTSHGLSRSTGLSRDARHISQAVALRWGRTLQVGMFARRTSPIAQTA